MSDDHPLHAALYQLALGHSLSKEATAAAFGVVMRGAATPSKIAALILGLRAKGETADEVAGAVQALRHAMVQLESDNPDALVDTCGTGGGDVSTLNISSAAAFLVAGAGVPVAKHGNRSSTSRSGSADVFEALGIDIMLPADRAAEVLRQLGLVFLFAPAYHPAMRHVGPIRKELGVPTIMNLLGPLANPAGVVRQAVGVGDISWAPRMAQGLAQLGTKHALVLHAAVGMDEISPRGMTRVWEVQQGKVMTWELDPARYGLADDHLEGLAGSDPAANAARIERLLNGDSDRVTRCTTLLNAAAALYVAGKGWSFAESVDRATAALESGAAVNVLRRLREAAPLNTS